mmetsp:Transcript_66794/g.149074  ORF Transcript_66794/g.149074 Transcript_66794/m.149074 type:complete len:230 (-) Transcript_66794:64-753(-)
MVSAAATCSGAPHSRICCSVVPGSVSFATLMRAPVFSRIDLITCPPGPITRPISAVGTCRTATGASDVSTFAPLSTARLSAAAVAIVSAISPIATCTCSDEPEMVTSWLVVPGIFSFAILIMAPDRWRKDEIMLPPAPMSLPMLSRSCTCLTSVIAVPLAPAPAAPTMASLTRATADRTCSSVPEKMTACRPCGVTSFWILILAPERSRIVWTVRPAGPIMRPTWSFAK